MKAVDIKPLSLRSLNSYISLHYQAAAQFHYCLLVGRLPEYSLSMEPLSCHLEVVNTCPVFLDLYPHFSTVLFVHSTHHFIFLITCSTSQQSIPSTFAPRHCWLSQLQKRPVERPGRELEQLLRRRSLFLTLKLH